jgi:hypothetical protein
MRRWVVCLATLLILTSASPVFAQTNFQLWGNLIFDWIRSDSLTFELDVEPKVLIVKPADQPGWWSLDLTPKVEYAAAAWLDLIGELGTAYTKQTDDMNSTEVTGRAGVRLHFLSREERRLMHRDDRPPKRRVVIRDRILVESRHHYYSGGGSGSDHTVRFRNRLEFQMPINTAKVTDNGARYLLSDWEWFIPLDDPAERFANRQRIRAGFGYRHDRSWRFEALYMWSRSRDTTGESFKSTDHILDLRVKRVF